MGRFTDNDCCISVIKSSRHIYPKKYTLKDTLKDTSKDTLKDTSKDTLKDTSKDTLKDTSKDTLKDTSKDTLQNFHVSFNVYSYELYTFSAASVIHRYTSACTFSLQKRY